MIEISEKRMIGPVKQGGHHHLPAPGFGADRAHRGLALAGGAPLLAIEQGAKMRLYFEDLATGATAYNLLQNNGYEPWRMDSHLLNVGLNFYSMTFDTGDAITGCASVACTALVPRPGNSGADHRIRSERVSIATNPAERTFVVPILIRQMIVPCRQHFDRRQSVEFGRNVHWSNVVARDAARQRICNLFQRNGAMLQQLVHRLLARLIAMRA